MNAKELTLKKINADTNWVDIYTTGFMLGESLDSIANLMLDPYITEVLNNFNSSVFDNERNSSKIAYIQGLIQNAKNEKNIAAENLLSFLLNRVKDAEELRILGKMLKINQGISTNTVEQFNYIKAIESFIESAYNADLKTLINESNRLSRIEREIDRQASEEGIVYPETSEKYDNLLSSIVTTLKESYGFTEEQIKDFIQNKSNYRNITFINLWNRFSLLKFIEDRNYADDWINRYEGVKRHFNILDVIDKVPHFREMFKVLDINTRILNTLSTRNHLESIILNSTIPNGDPRRKLSTDDIRKIKSAIDDHIINSWLIDKDLVISIAPHALDNVVEYQTSISSIEQIQQFRRYVESYVIPLLKEKLPNNKFIQQLIFGVKNDTPFYKLPFNMVQIDNTAKTKLTYEETLRDFNKLNNIKIDGIDMNLVDVFYLYNLIVNKDKFGPNSLTRIFEDVLASPGNEKLLVYDFNKWLDEQDPMLLAKTFTYPEIEGEDKEYYSDLDSSIGFKSEPTESDIEEAQIESASDTQTNPNNTSNPQVLLKTWNRTSENSYEVSTKGDRRFSALVATFKPGTIIDGVDVSEMTIEDVYQKVIKKSSKGKAPSKDSKLFIKNNPFNISKVSEDKRKLYSEQTGIIIDHIESPTESDLNDYQFAEITLVTTNGERIQMAPTAGYQDLSNVVRNKDIKALIGLNFLLETYLLNNPSEVNKFGNSVLSEKAKELYGEDYQESKDNFKSDYNSYINKEDFSYYVGYLPLWKEWANQNPELIEDLKEKSKGKVLTDQFATTRVNQARALADIINEQNNISKVENNTQSTYYDTKPSVRAELIEKIKAADMKGLHIVYDSDLVNDDSTTRNAKGFVRNGEIYINVDRATNDTVIHEFGHLYLADAKLNHPNEYYELLSEVRKTDIWKRMRSMIEYQNKRGSDFDEEVLATIISNYYKNNRENPDSPFSENAYFAVKALDLVSPEFKEFLLSDTIPQLSDTLITNYKDQQKLATVKNQLTKDNIIKEDCK